MSSLSTDHNPLAFELEIADWVNSHPLKLSELRGNVVVLYFFQMLCPACVIYATPIAKKIHELKIPHLKLIGIHSVFEHHEAMSKKSLLAYIHEFRLNFAIGIDQPNEKSHIPKTMEKYGLQGTPSFIIIDPEGYIKAHLFGVPDELSLGLFLGKWLGRE